MERANTTETKISVPDDKKSDKIAASVIECSVNMNVSLSRANKRSKIFQRALSLIIVIIAITFGIVCSHLKREVQALEAQINCVNTNLMMLMLRYEKLNKNFNRMRYHRVANNHRSFSETMDSPRKLNQSVTRHRHSSYYEENSNFDEVPKIENTTRIDNGSVRDKSTYKSEKFVESDPGKILVSDNVLDDDGTEENHNDSKNLDRDRYERAIVAFERRNHEMTTAISGSRDDPNDDSETWNETRTGRYRRDEARGKKRRKIKRRLKRSRRRLGPLIATFVGAVPEQHVTDTVYIGPWVKSTRNESRYAFNKFHLVEDKTSIEVTANGLYMISVQIYYFGEPSHFSYWILLSSEGTSSTRKVIKCATASSASASEASCYTSIVLPLRRGDRLHIQQQERDRLINLREGHSYVQVMLLTSESARRRGS